MAYKVIGPHSVLGVATGGVVDLSSMTHDEVRSLVVAGHVAVVEEKPAKADADPKSSK
jgi:hypothetical protein